MATQKDLVKKVNAGGLKHSGIHELIERSTKQLGAALPAHMRPERIVRIALTTFRMNPRLYECNPQSLLAALFQCAQLGLEPNVEGQAYIIPYRVQGRLEAQFQLGYKGLVELFWRHQNSISLSAEKVCENDFFEYDLGTGAVSHRFPPNFNDDRGMVIGYYACAQLSNGGRAAKVMSKREITDWGKRFSKCFDKKAGRFMTGTPWAEHFDAMALKTVLKQLMKLLPKSIEIQKALAADESVKTVIAKDMFEVPSQDIHSDETNGAQETPEITHQPKEVEPVVSDKISEEQYAYCLKLAKSAGLKEQHLVDMAGAFGVEDPKDLLKSDFSAFQEKITETIDKKGK